MWLRLSLLSALLRRHLAHSLVDSVLLLFPLPSYPLRLRPLWSNCSPHLSVVFLLMTISRHPISQDDTSPQTTLCIDLDPPPGFLHILLPALCESDQFRSFQNTMIPTPSNRTPQYSFRPASLNVRFRYFHSAISYLPFDLPFRKTNCTDSDSSAGR